MSKVDNWKRLEKEFPLLLQKYGIPAYRREQRQANYAISIDDVGITGHDYIKIDTKYQKAGWSVNTLLNTLKKKYCKTPDDFGVIVTKGGSERGQKVVIQDDFFAILLSYWLGYKTKEELLEIYHGK